MPEVRPPDGDPTPTAPLTRREARELAARDAARREAAAEPPAPEPVDAGTPAAQPTAPEPAPADPPAQPTAAPADPPTRPVAAAPENPQSAAAASGHHRAHRSHTQATPALEDLFAGETTTDALGAVPAKKSKRQKRRGRFIGLAIVIVVLGGIGAGVFAVWNTYEPQIRSIMGWEEPKDYEPGLAHGEALITIESGDTGAAVSTSLAAAGVTKTPGAFYDMLVSTGANPTFYPGVYKLQKEMTSQAALKTLLDPASKQENAALLPEGLTEEQTLDRLADALDIPRKDFTAAVKNPGDYGVDADSLEGWLFPALYEFAPDVTAKDVVKTMVKRTVTSLDNAGVPEADRQRILTIASIIQREAREEKDFYKVSRVIANRLDPSNTETGGKLQMDSTAQYGYGEMHDGTASSSQAALDDDNPWNTYLHPGLPIGPIANPGDVAIDAAMHPAKGPWLYFVTVNMDTGKTVFSTTNAEHEVAKQQMRAWCTDHPDSGC